MVAIALVTIVVLVLYLKCSTCCLEWQVESPLSLGTIQCYSLLPVVLMSWSSLLHPFPFRQVGLVDHPYPQFSTCTYDLESVSLAGDSVTTLGDDDGDDESCTGMNKPWIGGWTC
jgi:hypothetical protein